MKQALRLFALVVFSVLTSGLAIAHPGGVDKNGCHKESSTGKRHCHPERVRRKPEYNREHPPKAGDEGVFYGPLIEVVDGDTFKARIQGVVMTFRLQGVDAPEHDQPYGASSTAVLREITRGKELVLVFEDVDTYGRIVTDTWVGNLPISAEMVRRGAAWFDSVYSSDDELYWLEEEARKQKWGLWALPPASRVEPWVWRKEDR